MTTAARPTFDTARGGRGKQDGDLSAMTKQYSSRDLPGHTKLKYRQEGQNHPDELRGHDFRRDLSEHERASRDRKKDNRDTVPVKRSRLELLRNPDADDPLDEERDDDEDDDDDEEEDDTAELLAELNRIKQERAQERVEEEARRKLEEEKIRTDNILKGNPLLPHLGADESAEFKIKRRWDDDVVFKNCAKGEEARRPRGFINDATRNEFHRRFMAKYVK